MPNTAGNNVLRESRRLELASRPIIIRTGRHWLNYTDRDGRQRDTHGMMNGQTVDSFSKFRSPSGAELMFPGDPEAPAEEVINCRCVMVPGVLKPDERVQSDYDVSQQNVLINSKDEAKKNG